MIALDFKIEKDDLEKNILALNLPLKQTKRKIIQKVLSKGRTKVKASYKRVLEIKTGDLLKSLYIYSKKEDLGILAINSKKQYKAQTLEYGKKIMAKSSRYLTFKIGEKWIKTESVNIRPHPFFDNTISSYIRGNEIDLIIAKTLEDQIKKVWN